MKENDLHMMSRDAEFDARCRSLLEGREVTPPPLRPGIIAEASPVWNRTRTMAAGVLVLVAAAWWFSGADGAAVDSGDAPAQSAPADNPPPGASTALPTTGAETVDADPPSESPIQEGVESMPEAAVGVSPATPATPAAGDAEHTTAAQEERAAVAPAEAAGPAGSEEVVEQPLDRIPEDADGPLAPEAAVGTADEAVEAEAVPEPPAEKNEVEGEEGGSEPHAPDAPKIRLPLTLPSGGGQR